MDLRVLTYYGVDGAPKPAQSNAYSYNTDGSLKSHERSNYNYWNVTGDGSLLKKSRDDYAWAKHALTAVTSFNLTTGAEIKEQNSEYVYSPFFTVTQLKTTDFITPSGTDVALWTMQENSRWLYRRITQPDGAYSEFSYDDSGRIKGQSNKDAAAIELQTMSYTYPSPGKRVMETNSQYYNEEYLLVRCGLEQLQKGLYAPQTQLLCLPSYFFE